MDAATAPSSGHRPTAAEAERAWRAWKTAGDVKARDHLVLSYAPMVRYLVSRKARELPAHCEADDLVSSGLLALVAAVDRYDPAKGATFEQYAWNRVVGAILDELRRLDWASRSSRRLQKDVEHVRRRWLAQTGALPTEAELARDLGLDEADLRRRLSQLEGASIVSLNAPVGGAGEGRPVEIGATIRAPEERNPELLALASERGQSLREAIASLSDRERKVLTLVHVHHLGGAEIGRELGVSESRVSQILSGVRAKLRERLDAYDSAADGPIAA